MTIEEIIRAWKTEQTETLNQPLLENPAGHELSERELEEVFGGLQEGAAYTREPHCYYSNDPGCYRSMGMSC